MIDYCDKYSNLTTIWLQKGLSPCLFYTVFPSLFFLFSVCFGLIQLIIYARHSVRLEAYQISNSSWFPVQLFTIFALVCESFVRISLVTTLVNHGTIYGYQWVASMFSASGWSMLGAVVFIECRRTLPSIPARGHGLVPILAITLAFLMENVCFVSYSSPIWWFYERSQENNIELGLFCVRYSLTLISFILILSHPSTMLTRPPGYENMDEANDPMIDIEEAVSMDDVRFEGQSRLSSTWSSFKKQLALFWPFMWPRGSLFLQLLVLMCLFLLVMGRVVNLFMPIYYKKIVDSLSIKNQSAIQKPTSDGDGSAVNLGVLQMRDIEFRWDFITVYVFLWFLQGGSSGFISNIRSFLWTWVQQYTTRAVEVKLFSHLHSLSMRWHLSRKTGEVLRIMDRGTNSINNLLNYLLFNILPTIADILIAIVFFLTSFSAWFALIIFITMILYLIATIVITEWRTKYRRSMNKLDNDMNTKAVDSLLNFETVKYYGTEGFEVNRYQEAVLKYQVAERKNNFSLNFLNIFQTTVISLGLLSGSILCAWYVSNGDLTVGDYVLFATYINQLYTPLNWFGSYYRVIQQSFIDMENMFDLLKEKQEVKDDEHSPDLVVTNGQIDFQNVSFHYRPDKKILKDISFTVPPGHTYALVGPSGAGKSTIIRLMFRFYDVLEGRILIDEQDISKVKQKSLRSVIGVVPQDTVLFNDDIEYNIRYGRVDATGDEVIEAARIAEIHSGILSFPDGYKTKVGERGLKLSGGEKQRVAIARTILKSPTFVLLDEATSALDTKTERQIQSSLAKVCENRTTLIVAHRLSTIIHADKIIVLKDGSVVESGRHEDLLQVEEGVYCDMWKQQLTNNNTDLSNSQNSSNNNNNNTEVDV